MKPILFNTEMVRAILDGRKTQTRRVAKDCKNYIYEDRLDFTPSGCFAHFRTENGIPSRRKTKYKVDDILYVRETFVIGVPDGTMPESDTNPITVFYKADNSVHGWIDENEDECNIPWKPSIHMPKEYARIFLRVTNVRVERLQDITYKDILKEGYKCSYHDIYDTGWMSHKATFYGDINNNEFKSMAEWFTDWWVKLWNSTTKEGYKWEDNPYVFVYEFERINYVK